MATLTNISSQGLTLTYQQQWAISDPTCTIAAFISAFGDNGLTFQPGQQVSIPSNFAAQFAILAGNGQDFTVA